MIFIDPPVFYPRENYYAAIDSVLQKLKNNTDIISLYQIGSVSVPGISDIDLVAVYNNEYSTNYNPIANLTNEERYFFVHSLFGASRQDFKSLNEFLIQVNYNHVYGEKIEQAIGEKLSDVKELKEQIAIEYLLKNFISIYRQKVAGIVKLRSLLLEANALKYDFDLLDVKDGRIVELVFELVDWRMKWFDKKPTEKKMEQWFKEYFTALYHFLSGIFEEHKLYSMNNFPVTLMRRCTIEKGTGFKYSSMGIPVNALFFINSAKRLRLSQKINTYKFSLPCKQTANNTPLFKRFAAMKEIQSYNLKHIPYFQAMTSVLPELYM
ncbi:MAG: hypothetical protein IPJ79_09765 [Bacteroidetes bacterium]|nr:hypothetical protein [Bacteroidota bacterium]